MKRLSFLTIFPEMFDGFLSSPLVKRRIAGGLLEAGTIDIKQFAPGSFRRIDDSPYGGGPGMILRCQPVVDALETVRGEEAHTIILSPSGHPYRQTDAHRLSKKEHLIMICGHYEGLDARIFSYADEVISIGDYILSGGEIAAMAVVDSVIRILDGTIRRASTEEESFENGLLEYPQYTRPAEFRGAKVPEVLLSGNHEAVRKWRLKESLRETLKKRPDLLENRDFTEEEKELLKSIREE